MMQFTKFILENKGSNLALVWIAAHHEKKLKRSNVCKINIESCISDIISYQIYKDLKVSGHLLAGMARIYSKKLNILLFECGEIFCRVKTVFRGSVLDLPKVSLKAAKNKTTLPELYTFDELDQFSVTEVSQAMFISRPEDITLTESTEALAFPDDIESIVLYGNREELILEDEFGNDGELIHPSISEVPETNDPSPPSSLELPPCEPPLCEPDTCRMNAEQRDYLVLKPIPAMKKPKGVRKFKMDACTTLSHETLKHQMVECKVGPLFGVPLNKRAMHLKEIANAEKLLSLPGRHRPNPKIMALFKCHMVVPKNVPCEEEEEEEMEVEVLEQWRKAEQSEFIEPSIVPVSLNATQVPSSPNATHMPSLNATHMPSLLNATQVCNMFPSLEQFEPEVEPMPDLEPVPEPSVRIDFLTKAKSQSSNDTESSFIYDQRMGDLFANIQQDLQNHSVKFSSLCQGKKRLQVARSFSMMLFLKKRRLIEMHQETPNEIIILKGANFDEADFSSPTYASF